MIFSIGNENHAAIEKSKYFMTGYSLLFEILFQILIQFITFNYIITYSFIVNLL